jgi:hypothetical protein
MPIFIPPVSPQTPSRIIWSWYNRPVSGRSTQSPTAQIKKKKAQIWHQVSRRQFFQNVSRQTERLYYKKVTIWTVQKKKIIK